MANSGQTSNNTVLETFVPLQESNTSLPLQIGTFTYVSVASNTIILSYQFQQETGVQYL